MDVFYRLSQLWHNLIARPPTQPELEEIGTILNSAEKNLFLRMSPSDQQHAYRVFKLLKASGQTDTDLLAAALLHDVGKIRVRLTPWDRSLAVLGETFMPGKVPGWGEGDTIGWRKTFVVRKQHAAWGATLAKEAGSRAVVVDLIFRHQDVLPQRNDNGEDPLLLLQWADNQS